MRQVCGEGLGVHKGLRFSEQVAIYESEIEDLRAMVDTLKGALGAEHPMVELVDKRPGWMTGLCRQERALVGALMAVSPRAISRLDLLEMLPGRDHAEDRQVQLVTTVTSNVRGKLGREVIKSLHGEGYFMPTAERDRLLASE